MVYFLSNFSSHCHTSSTSLPFPLPFSSTKRRNRRQRNQSPLLLKHSNSLIKLLRNLRINQRRKPRQRSRQFRRNRISQIRALLLLRLERLRNCLADREEECNAVESWFFAGEVGEKGVEVGFECEDAFGDFLRVGFGEDFGLLGCGGG